MWTKAKTTLPPLPRAIPIHFPDPGRKRGLTGHLGLCQLWENKVQAEHIYHEATLPCAPVGKPVCSVTNVIKPANDSTQT